MDYFFSYGLDHYFFPKYYLPLSEIHYFTKKYAVFKEENFALMLCIPVRI